MGYSTDAKNAMLDHLASLADFLSLHTASPGDTGANEVTGGTPAYSREAATWTAASGGSAPLSNDPVFDVPAGTTVTHVGMWSAATAGTFYGFAAVTNEEFASQGTYTVTAGTVDLNA
jgi:hypothetical protein